MIRILDLGAMFGLICLLIFLILRRKFDPKVSFVLFVAGFVIITFRTIGDDTIQYVGIYHALEPSFDNFTLKNVNGFTIEPLWFFIISILKSVGFSNPYFFFFISSFLPFLGVYWVYKKSKLFDRSFDVYFYFLFWLILYQFAINGVRAFASTCFVILALWFFYNAKYIKTFLVSMLVILLHSSGFILLLFFVIMKMKLNKKSLLFSFLTCLTLLAVFFQIDWSDPYFSRLYFKLDYYLFAVEQDMLINNSGRELYVFFSRSLFIASITYCFIVLMLSLDIYGDNGFVTGIYRCSLVTTFACMALLFFGVFLFSYRLIMFIQPLILLVFCYSLSRKPKKYKLPMFFVFTGWYWVFFILFASRFYDA